MDIIVAIVGDVVGGVELFGPFDDFEHANEWCANNVPADDWHTIHVNKPESR